MTKQQKLLLKSAILTMSFVQMSTTAIAPFLADIGRAFPEAPTEKVQFLMTFPSIFGMIAMFLSAAISRKTGKRLTAVLGLATVAVSGIGAVLAHGSIDILFVWAMILGLGYGLVSPIPPALIGESFEGNEAKNMLGLQNSAANIGSMLMTFFGGILAAHGWWFGYLVYLIGLPGLVLSLVGVRETRRDAEAGNGSFSLGALLKDIWKALFISWIFMLLFNAIPSNLSMLITEQDLGASQAAGIVSALFLAGGMVAGFIYGPLSARIGAKTTVAGVLTLALGAFVGALCHNLILLCIACLIGGMSIGLLMPHIMQTPARYPGRGAFVTALIMGAANIGVFCTPILTKLTNQITGTDLAANRFLAVGIASLVLSVLVGVVFLKKDRTKK
ncbi:MAG: MFS transporter [Firmicutes bacterium]|nr:MFS transporter [Bacillota bacterium]